MSPVRRYGPIVVMLLVSLVFVVLILITPVERVPVCAPATTVAADRGAVVVVECDP